MEFNSLIFESEDIRNYQSLIDLFEELLIKNHLTLAETIGKLARKFRKTLVGKTRIVFIFDDVVVKIVLDVYEAETNKKEMEAVECLGVAAPQIIDYDKNNYYWLVMEKVENNKAAVIKKARELFPNLTKTNAFGLRKSHEDNPEDYFVVDGIGKVQDLNKLKTANKEEKKQNAYTRLSLAASEEGKEWLDDFVNGIEKCGVNTSDLQYFNFGVSFKTNRLVPLDLG